MPAYDLENPILERNLQLEAANAQLAELALTFDKAQTIIQSLDGTILFWNSGSEALYGWLAEEALGRKSHELLQTEFPRPFAEIQAELLAHGVWKGEFRQRRRDGLAIWVASCWALHRNAAGKPVSVVEVNTDITELKSTSEALAASEATVRSLFENAGHGILTVDREGRIVGVNRMMLELFGYSRAELIGLSVDMLVPDGLRRGHVSHSAGFALQPRMRPMGQNIDLLARRKDGSEFPVEIGLSHVADQHGGGLAIAFISDITARKQASREREVLISKLEGALAEKTVLLREVHHRVKNNLAVIAGLLGMQADSLDDKRAQVALNESQQRVLSMAMIHEFLYASEHLDRVNFGKYVHQLARVLCASYPIVSDLIGITIEADECELPVHRAIPCGLILNELLSNAFKYGFPNGRRGNITVRVTCRESGNLTLTCQDDGVGIPVSFDWQNPTSLGLRIVKILTKQIDGVLKLDRGEGGTRFELSFQAQSR